MEQIFISHSSTDRPFVEGEIVSLLRDHALKPWYSADDVPTAARWEREIFTALQSLPWFLIVLTPQAVKSSWVQAEVRWAIENRRDHIVPVMLRECDVASLSLQLPAYQYVDYRTDLLVARNRLLSVWGASVSETQALQVRLSVEDPYTESPDRGQIDSMSVLIEKSCIIGTHRGAGIRLMSPLVSLHHAVLKVRQTQDGARSLLLADLFSSNGTWHNGVPLTEPTYVTVGDAITVGDVKLRVEAISYPCPSEPAEAGDA